MGWGLWIAWIGVAVVQAVHAIRTSDREKIAEIKHRAELDELRKVITAIQIDLTRVSGAAERVLEYSEHFTIDEPAGEVLDQLRLAITSPPDSPGMASKGDRAR